MRGLLLLAAMWLLALLPACAGPASPPPPAGALPVSRATPSEPFEPLPRELGLDPAMVAIGERLFADRRLSGDGTRACVDCHDLAHSGIVPHEARSTHPDDGPYNVPTVFNVAFLFRLNWQGTAETLEEHASLPLMNPRVMNAGGWPALLARLAPYDGDFRHAGHAAGVDEAGVRAALATYERSLLTPDSAFDRYLRGEAPLPAPAATGYDLFRAVGCVSCHQGIGVGGNLFQRFGVMADPFADREEKPRDQGRRLLTGDEADDRVFRVPSLRNVAVTAPYFHDGSAPTLDDAVRRMARLQLGYDLQPDEVVAIVAFLGTLTGEYRGVPLQAAP